LQNEEEKRKELLELAEKVNAAIVIITLNQFNFFYFLYSIGIVYSILFKSSYEVASFPSAIS